MEQYQKKEERISNNVQFQEEEQTRNLNQNDLRYQIKNFQISKSQFYESKYFPIMKDIPAPPLDRIRTILQQNGILWLQQPEQKFFKQLIKTNWQSTTYLIKIGHMSGYLNILNFHQDSKKFTPRMINKGQYGTISVFQYFNKELVLKNIKFDILNPQKFDFGLMELFMLKVGSYLQIGPEFFSLCGYDAILFDDCLQFCMECCTNNYIQQDIIREKTEKQLYRNLKILHTLKICHCDIKLENVAFSQRFHKFVFLDFGFTTFIREDPGYKTLMRFKGTYNYCSEEMKKNYFLRQYVDLYYNDLHCLQKTFEALQKFAQPFHSPLNRDHIFSKMQIDSKDYSQLKFKSILGPQKPQTIENKQNEDYSYEYESLLRFFHLKFLLFSQKFDKISDIAEKQQKLLLTFNRILLNKKQKYSQLQNAKNCISSRNQAKNHTFQQKIDTVLYNYLIKVQNLGHNYLWCQRMSRMKQMSLSKNILKYIWGNQNWMVEIFYFIDINSDQMYQDEMRRDFFIDLYDFIYKNVPQSNKYGFIRQRSMEKLTNFTLMYRHIMIVLFQYFVEKQNYTVLEQIFSYFAFFDYINKEIAERQILKVYESKKSTMGYIIKNMQFFLCKNLYLDLKHIIGQNNYKKNMKKMKEKLINQNKLNPNKQIKKMIKIIDSYCELINLFIVESITLEKVQNFQKNATSHDFRVLIKLVFNNLKKNINNSIQFHIQNKLTVLKFQNKYIKNNYVRSFQNNYYNRFCLKGPLKISNQMIFKCYFHFCQYKPQVIHNKKNTIQSELLEVSSFDYFAFSDLLLFFISYLIQRGYFSEKRLFQAIQSFKISNAKNFRDLYLLLDGLGFLLRKFNVNQGMISLMLSICCWTQNLLKIAQENNRSQLIEYIGDDEDFDYKTVLKLQIYFIKSCTYRMLQQYENSFNQIIKLGDYINNAQFLQHLCNLYDLTLEKDLITHQKICKLFLIFYEKPRKEPQFIQTEVILSLLIKLNRKIQAIDYLIYYLKSLFSSSFLYDYYTVPLIFKVLQVWDNQMSNHFVRIVKNISMKGISQNPQLSIFLFLNIVFQRNRKKIMTKEYFRRVLSLCATGFQKLKYCFMKNQKIILTIFMLENFKKKRKFRPFEQIMYRTVKDINIESKYMRKLSKTKIPEKAHIQVYDLLKNLSKYSYDHDDLILSYI